MLRVRPCVPSQPGCRCQRRRQRWRSGWSCAVSTTSPRAWSQRCTAAPSQGLPPLPLPLLLLLQHRWALALHAPPCAGYMQVYPAPSTLAVVKFISAWCCEWWHPMQPRMSGSAAAAPCMSAHGRLSSLAACAAPVLHAHASCRSEPAPVRRFRPVWSCQAVQRSYSIAQVQVACNAHS